MLDRLASDVIARRPLRQLRCGRLLLEIRLDVSPVRQLLVIGGSLVLGILISATILIAVGVPPSGLWEEFVLDTVFDAHNLHSVWFLAGPLAFIGLAAATAFRCGFWNLGLEGQMVWGGIAGTFVSLYHVGPESTRLVTMLVAAALAGGLWVMVPLLLKSRFAVNEIISTLLLNYVASYFLIYLLYGPWLDPRDGFPHSPVYAPFERLPDLPGGFSSAVLLAFAATFLIAWLVLVSRAGLYIRFVNDNPMAALAVGVPIGAVTLVAIGLSGALAGFGGEVMLAGAEGRLTYSYFPGYGFSGVLIAFLARNHPFGVLAVAVLVAILFIAGQNLQIFFQIPGSMVQVIEAIIVFSVASAEFFLRHRLHWVH
jgi:general nucleoside transport system permease protein